jgi:hypothetical protein
MAATRLPRVSESRMDTERGFIVTGRQISRTEAGPLKIDFLDSNEK